MRPVNRRGIELSVNFIVILIMAVVVFGFGIYLMRQISGQSDTFLKMKSNDFMNQLDNIACEGSEFVCIGITEKDVKQGGIAVFTLNILNHYSEQKYFTVKIEALKIEALTPSDNKMQFLPPSSGETYEIDAGALKRIPIAVHPAKGTPLGTYQLKVNVSEPDTTVSPPSQKIYGSPMIIYVVVT